LLNAVIKETFRFITAVPIFSRISAIDDVIPLSKPLVGRSGQLIEALHVPKGTRIEGSLTSFNYLEDIWGPDVNEFKPSRFLKPTPTTVQGAMNGIIPFITGPRMCLGWRFALLEMQVLIVELLDTFEFGPIDRPPYKMNSPIMSPIFDNKIQMLITLKRADNRKSIH